MENHNPAACFTVDPAGGLTTTTFVFDASCSQDEEDPLADLRFEWDWEADTIFDEVYTGIPTANHRFPTPGEHEVHLKVVDSGGLSHRDTLFITVTEFLPDPYVTVEAGTFTMGSPPDELGATWDEMPQHSVTLTHDFIMGSTEVTNQQFVELAQWAYDNGHIDASPNSVWDGLDGSAEELVDLDSDYSDIQFEFVIVGEDTSGFFSLHSQTRLYHPVKEVTWFGAASYCDWLSLSEGFDRAYDHSSWECNGGDPYNAEGYRLPTEAEWEYACRAGSQTAFANGPISADGCEIPADSTLEKIGWYCGNAGGSTHPVAQRQPNAWGLYDMHGNIWEWCNDWFYVSYYGISPATDPPGPDSGDYRILRGGFFSSYAEVCRSGDRPLYTARSFPQSYIGFRVVRKAD